MSNKDRIGDLLLGEGEDPAKQCEHRHSMNVELKCKLAAGHMGWHLCAYEHVHGVEGALPPKHDHEECHRILRGVPDREVALAAAESKIAALKVDLAGMQKERDEAKYESTKWERRFEVTADELGKTFAERDAALADLSQERAEVETWKTRLLATDKMYDLRKSQLARALAALQSLVKVADPYYSQRTVGVFQEVYAILADPESTAAVEAYAEIEAALEAARPFANISAGFRDALAKVDARRAGGKDGAK